MCSGALRIASEEMQKGRWWQWRFDFMEIFHSLIITHSFIKTEQVIFFAVFEEKRMWIWSRNLCWFLQGGWLFSSLIFIEFVVLQWHWSYLRFWLSCFFSPGGRQCRCRWCTCRHRCLDVSKNHTDNFLCQYIDVICLFFPYRFTSTPCSVVNKYYLGPAPLEEMARYEVNLKWVGTWIVDKCSNQFHDINLCHAGKLLLLPVRAETTETICSS